MIPSIQSAKAKPNTNPVAEHPEKVTELREINRSLLKKTQNARDVGNHLYILSNNVQLGRQSVTTAPRRDTLNLCVDPNIQLVISLMISFLGLVYTATFCVKYENYLMRFYCLFTLKLSKTKLQPYTNQNAL